MISKAYSFISLSVQMSRWTPSGWTTCLGAAFRWNSWEGRCGLDFLLETQTRSALGNHNHQAYCKRVGRLEWLSFVQGEDQRSVLNHCTPHSQSPWLALSLAQRQSIASSVSLEQKAQPPRPQLSQNNQIQAIIDAPMDRGEVDCSSGSIVIPASATSHPNRETRTIFFPKSFGKYRQQLLLPQKGTVVYKIPGHMLQQQNEASYQLWIRYCSVHRHEEPLVVSIYDDPKKDPVVSTAIPLEYTNGTWGKTKPVRIVFSVAGDATLEVTRKHTDFAIGVDSLHLECVA